MSSIASYFFESVYSDEDRLRSLRDFDRKTRNVLWKFLWPRSLSFPALNSKNMFIPLRVSLALITFLI